mgnify:CR=1 FL=1
MLFKYFTVQTANEALPVVIEKYENIKKQKMEVIKAEQQLQITLSDNNTFEEYVVLKPVSYTHLTLPTICSV